MIFKFAQFWPISSFRLMKPKLTQMHPNDFKLCMGDIEGYQEILMHIMNSHTLYKLLFNFVFYCRERRTKTLEKLMLKPPRVDDTFGSPNAVRTSQLSEQITEIHIRHQCMLCVPILFYEILQVLTVFGEPKVSSTLGGFNIIFPSVFVLLSLGSKKVVEEYENIMRIHNMNQDVQIPIKLFHT